MARLAFGILLLLALICAGCTPEQEKKAGNALTSTGQGLKTGSEIAGKVLPGPTGVLLEAILGGLATVSTAAGAYYLRKSRQERTKKKAYKAQLNQPALDAANRQIFGDSFKAELSKF